MTHFLPRWALPPGNQVLRYLNISPGLLIQTITNIQNNFEKETWPQRIYIAHNLTVNSQYQPDSTKLDCRPVHSASWIFYKSIQVIHGEVGVFVTCVAKTGNAIIVGTKEKWTWERLTEQANLEFNASSNRTQTPKHCR